MIRRCVIALVVFGAGVASAQIPLARSRKVIRDYAISTGYPNGRPGYVVDHQIPLCAGGTDAAENLQWQERRASYLKDEFERELCRDMQRLHLIMIKREP